MTSTDQLAEYIPETALKSDKGTENSSQATLAEVKNILGMSELGDFPKDYAGTGLSEKAALNPRPGTGIESALEKTIQVAQKNPAKEAYLMFSGVVYRYSAEDNTIDKASANKTSTKILKLFQGAPKETQPDKMLDLVHQKLEVVSQTSSEITAPTQSLKEISRQKLNEALLHPDDTQRMSTKIDHAIQVIEALVLAQIIEGDETSNRMWQETAVTLAKIMRGQVLSERMLDTDAPFELMNKPKLAEKVREFIAEGRQVAESLIDSDLGDRLFQLIKENLPHLSDRDALKLADTFAALMEDARAGRQYVFFAIGDKPREMTSGNTLL